MPQPTSGPGWRLAVDSNLKATNDLLRAMGTGGVAPQPAPTQGRRVAEHPLPSSQQGEKLRSTPLFATETAYGAPTGTGFGSAAPHPFASHNVNSQQSTLIQQVKNLSAEMEMERGSRKEADKQLHELFSLEISRLHDSMHALKLENATLKQQMQEVASMRSRGSAAGHVDPAELATTGIHRQTAGGYNSASSQSQTLIDRVIALEDTVAKHTLQLDDRSQRLFNTLRDSLNGKIDVEIERCRSIAREAAKTTSEDVIALRMSALSSAFGKQVLEVEQVCSKMTNRFEEQTSKLQQVEETSKTLAHRLDLLTIVSQDKAKVQLDFKDEVLREAESRVELERQRLEAAMTQLRNDMSAQQRKATSENLQSQQVLQQYIAQRMDTLSAQGVLRDEVQRMINHATGVLESEIGGLVRSHTALKQLSDDARNELGKRLASVEQKIHDQVDQMSALTTREGASVNRLQRMSQDVDELKSRQQAMSSDVDALKAGSVEVATTLETLKGSQSHFSGLTLKLEQDLAANVVKCTNACKTAESCDTRVASLLSRVEQSALEQNKTLSLLQDQVSTVQRELRQVTATQQKLSATVEELTGEKEEQNAAESVLELSHAMQRMEKKLTERVEANDLALRAHTQETDEKLSRVENWSRSNTMKGFDPQRLMLEVQSWEEKVEQLEDRLSNDRRRDYEQMSGRLADAMKRLQDVRGEIEDQSRKTKEVLAQSSEVALSTQKALAEKTNRTQHLDLEEKMKQHIGDMLQRLLRMDDIDAKISDCQSMIAQLQLKCNTVPTSSASSHTGASTQFSAADAVQLIEGYLTNSIEPQLAALRTDCTGAVTNAALSTKQVKELQAKVASTVKDLSALAEKTDTLSQGLLEAKAGLVSVRESTAEQKSSGREMEDPAATRSRELSEDELHARIDDNRYLIEVLQQHVNRALDTLTLHTNYFEEVREKVEEVCSGYDQMVQAAVAFVDEMRSAVAVESDDPSQQRFLSSPPENVGDAFSALGSSLLDLDRRYQVTAASMLSIIGPHTVLLRKLVDATHAFSANFQVIATQCGLDPEAFKFELLTTDGGGDEADAEGPGHAGADWEDPSLASRGFESGSEI